MKAHRATEYIPSLDDYELKPNYDFNYRKTKPNRFATLLNGTSKPQSDLPKKKKADGKIPHSVRKSKTIVTKRHTITLEQADAAYLHKLDKSLSQAIRKLILMQRKV